MWKSKTSGGRKEYEKAGELIKEMKEVEEEVNLDFMLKDMDSLLGESKNGLERVKKIVLDLRVFAREDQDQMEMMKVEETIEGILNIVYNELKYKVELKKVYRKIAADKMPCSEIGAGIYEFDY